MKYSAILQWVSRTFEHIVFIADDIKSTN